MGGWSWAGWTSAAQEILAGCLALFSPQIWLSLSRGNTGGGPAGLCCLSSIALPLTAAVRQLGPMWSSLKALHLEKHRRQEFSFFETRANIGEFYSTQFAASLLKPFSAL